MTAIVLNISYLIIFCFYWYFLVQIKKTIKKKLNKKQDIKKYSKEITYNYSATFSPVLIIPLMILFFRKGLNFQTTLESIATIGKLAAWLIALAVPLFSFRLFRYRYQKLQQLSGDELMNTL